MGLVGAGYIADWHARGLRALPGVRLAAVCDVAPARAEALAARHGIPAWHASLEEMLAREPLDAVHVLLPPDLHAGAARTAMAAGVDVFLEKPMSLRADECEALADLARDSGRRLGVGHNFLFSEPYVRLREDVRAGVLGRIDQVTLTWNRELPQHRFGPFDSWLLREPGNVMLEIGPHVAAHAIDLLGWPDELAIDAENPVTLPTGVPFYRRWRGRGRVGAASLDVRFSFVPGFGEYTLHVRGSLGSGTVDIDRDTYVLHRHHPADEDFDRYAMATAAARSLRKQARRTLAGYVLAKLHLRRFGTPYELSIRRAMEAFHFPGAAELDARIDARRGAAVIRLCQRFASAAPPVAPLPRTRSAERAGPAPRILVLGATGFIGQALVRHLREQHRPTRLLVRSPSKLPAELLGPEIEVVRGDLQDAGDLQRAMAGIECVLHLARASVKSWADYQRQEIEVTRRVGEAALAAGVRRLVYTGTIDSYYAGARAGTIRDDTPLDPRIARRNLYARAKAESEAGLRRLERERGLPLVVLRPGIVVGQGSSPFHWGVGMWRSDAICQIWGAGRTPLPLVLVDDVARALVLSVDAPGIEGRAFNLVGPPLLSAQEYLDELDRLAGIRLQRFATSPLRFYLGDMVKWAVKVLVRFPDRRLPSYRDWESRTQRARFDCEQARAMLGWTPTADRAELIRKGIAEPLQDLLR